MDKWMSILHAICVIAHNNDGKVKPSQVLRRVNNRPFHIPYTGRVSNYAVRQFFKSARDDGMLVFRGNHYRISKSHWIMTVGANLRDKGI